MRALLLALALFAAWPHQLEGQMPPLEASNYPQALSAMPMVLPHPHVQMTLKETVNAIFDELGKDAQFDKYSDLDRAWTDNQLVDIPMNDPKSGFYIRITGDFPIAQFEDDWEKKMKMFRLRPAGAGLLYLVADEYRYEFQLKYPVRWPQHYRHFGLTGLIRPWFYQVKLMLEGNENADTIKQGIAPTHTYGLAFDIGRALLTPEENRILLKVLMRLRDRGLCLFFTEGKVQSAYHVIALPDASPQLTNVYAKLSQPSISVAVTEQ